MQNRYLCVASILLSSVVGFTPLSSAAADEIFLKLDGVRGESMDKEHQREIEVLSYTQAMAGPFARGTTSAGAGAGKAVCGVVTILKYVDLASPDLILYSLNGRHIAKAEIVFRRTGSKFEYYKVIIDDVIVTELQQDNSKLNFPNPAPPRATEKVSLMGRRFRYEYAEQTQTGAKGGQPKAGWDCQAASKV